MGKERVAWRERRQARYLLRTNQASDAFAAYVKHKCWAAECYPAFSYSIAISLMCTVHRLPTEMRT
eukprot:6199518-Pleurochrysis_carterae.AAC.5